MLMCWASPPCTGGSPVINLIPEPRRSEIREQRMAEFKSLIESSRDVMLRCHVRCLELARPCMYWKERCAYTQSEEARAKHEFRIASKCMLFDPKRCQCNTHLPLNSQSLRALGVYPLKLVQKLASWFLRLQSLPE